MNRNGTWPNFIATWKLFDSEMAEETPRAPSPGDKYLAKCEPNLASLAAPKASMAAPKAEANPYAAAASAKAKANAGSSSAEAEVHQTCLCVWFLFYLFNV